MNYTNRRSIRSYRKDPIDEQHLSAILRGALRASNTGNMQTWSVVVTRDPAKKAALAPCHFGQPMVEAAPVVLTFCLDYNRLEKWCQASGAQGVHYDSLMAVYVATIDTIIAAQNAAVAAEDLGLGICFLGTAVYNMQGIIDILKLPRGVVPVTTITMGWPDQLPPLTERLPLEALVHQEEYCERSPEEVRALYRDIEANPANQAFVRENSKEALAQVFCEVRYSPESYRQFSAKMLEALRAQGFAV
ncbi:MAG: NADPH-dependent oxidoreductase [Bacteroidia bacterium]|nr:MAG: NADPH-dependent oxidoreductase [Bacteroidia bacterium]